MNSFEQLKGLVAEYIEDDRLAEQVADHCETLSRKAIFGYISHTIINRYLKSCLEVAPVDIAYYLSEKGSAIALYPNTGVDDVAGILEDHNFTASQILKFAKSYSESDDVLWVNTVKGIFGTIDEEKIVAFYKEDFCNWVIENEYEGFFGVGLDNDDDSDALVWIMRNKSKVIKIVDRFLDND